MMRAALVGVLMLATVGQSFGACSTAGLAGSWSFAASDMICTFYHVTNKGVGSGPCLTYKDGRQIDNQTQAIAISVASNCHVTGQIASRVFMGQSDPAMTLFVGALAGHGAATMMR